MSTAIQDLLKHSIGDGARPSKFQVQLMMPPSASYQDGPAITASAKTASFPGKAHEIIGLKIKGRNVPVRGQTKYTNSWDCTFYLSEDHALKIAFEEWIEAIDQKHNADSPQALGASALQGEFAGSGYTMPIVIYQNNFDLNTTTATYTLLNAFPTQITPVEISSDNVGSVSEFTVTFAYSHYLINGVTGGPGGVDVQGINEIFNIGRDITNNLANIARQNISSLINNVTSEIQGVAFSVLDNLVSSLF